jgi:hypothetical protein
MNDAAHFCSKAIAYLKAAEPNEGVALSLSEADSPALLSLGNGLLVSYVVDEGESFSYVQNRHLVEAHLSLEQLHEQACSNLSAIAKENLQIHEYGAIYAVILDGNFEASLILLNGLWEKELAHLAQSGFTVALPARDVLAFCESSSSDGISELRNLVSRLADGDHLLTPSLYRRTGNQWGVYAV